MVKLFVSEGVKIVVLVCCEELGRYVVDEIVVSGGDVVFVVGDVI